MKRLFNVLAVLSVIAVLVYWLVPERYFLDRVYPLEEPTVLAVYDDRADGGASDAMLSMVDSTIQFSCKLHTGDAPAWCGLLWNFAPDSAAQYRNWMLVDSIVFNIEVHGTDEFLMKLWTFDPDVTDEKNKFSFRPLIKEVKVVEGPQRVVIPVSELYVPEFWFKDQKVSKDLELKHQESVARFEITAGWNAKRGKPFTIKIHSIEGKGVSSFALGIMIFFFFAIITIAVGFRHKVVERDRKK